MIDLPDQSEKKCIVQFSKCSQFNTKTIAQGMYFTM